MGDPGPRVGIVGGSRSDFPVLDKAVAVLDALGVPNELRVVSAHRTPDHLFRYAETARGRGNTMYPLLDCVRAYATVGEMVACLKNEWGEFQEPVNV